MLFVNANLCLPLALHPLTFPLLLSVPTNSSDCQSAYETKLLCLVKEKYKICSKQWQQTFSCIYSLISSEVLTEIIIVIVSVVKLNLDKLLTPNH